MRLQESTVLFAAIVGCEFGDEVEEFVHGAAAGELGLLFAAEGVHVGEAVDVDEIADEAAECSHDADVDGAVEGTCSVAACVDVDADA